MIKVKETQLDGVKLIEHDAFEDFRGRYIETFNKKAYAQKGIDMDFVQDDISVSSRHVLRGIHGDDVTWKLISCLWGRFYLVVVNCNRESENFGQWEAFTLSDGNRRQVLVPPHYGNGHLVLSDTAIFHYKQTTYYNPDKQFTFKWDDPELEVWWPVKTPILSPRDEAGRFVT